MDVSSLNLLRGLRLRPTDEEIIDFLWSKNSGNDGECSHIREVHFYKHEPWDLPDFSYLEDQEWFFFSPLDPKHRNGKRSNRRTEAGYWKVTGKDDTIKVGKLVRTRRILVFYRGPSKGTKTDWVAHEYRITLEDGTNPFQNTLVLYHLFDRSSKNSNRGQGQKCGKSGPGVSISTRAKSPRASISPVSEVRGEDAQTECLHPENSGGTLSDGTATDQYTESGYGVYATADEIDLQLETQPQTPLTALSNTAAVTTTAKSSPEEAVFDQARASVSPPFGEEACNHLINCPANTFEGTMTPNSVVSTKYNHTGDYLYTIDNQLVEATTGEVGDLNMPDVPPEPLDWSILDSGLEHFFSEMQEEFGHVSQPVTNDLNCHQVGVPSEYGMYQPAADISFSRDSTPNNLDGLSLNDLNKNHVCHNANATENQAAGVVAGEVVDDSNMFDVASGSPQWSSLSSLELSPLSLEMLKDPGSSCMYDYLNYRHCLVPPEDGTNSPCISVLGLPDLIFDNPDEVPYNYPSSQNSMWSHEINGETSSGVLFPRSNYVGGTSIRSVF